MKTIKSAKYKEAQIVTADAFTVPSSPEADAIIGDIEGRIGRRLQQSERNEIIHTFNNVGTDVIALNGPKGNIRVMNYGKFEIQ